MSRAIVVSIDGLAAFYWADPAVRIPTLRALAARGGHRPGPDAGDDHQSSGAPGVEAGALDGALT